MKVFRSKLAALQPAKQLGRDWLYVPYDQLSERIGPMSRSAPGDLGIVLIESSWKPKLRPYHQQKLAFILANQRQFALEQAERGVAVRYLSTPLDYADALLEVVKDIGPLSMMRPAERELRVLLQPLVDQDRLVIEPHDGWQTTAEDFEQAGPPGGPWRMDRFYRAVRRRTGVLMEEGKPVGGKYSFDADNRRSWPGDPPAPTPPRFEPDEVTAEVAEFVSRAFADHPGRVDVHALPTTAADAQSMQDWALGRCLPHFGPFEDAMSHRSTGLFHTRLSPLLNVSRVLAADLIVQGARADAPLSSREGFIRQILGWREFVRHVHEATDGFRTVSEAGSAEVPGDAGWGRASPNWRDRTTVPIATTSAIEPAKQDGGAKPSILNAEGPLPLAYWGTPSGLACLDRCVGQVMEEGWTHHIPRLMVLSNLATLVGVSPREITDWFWVAFVDAFDWVVEPNVLAMGSFGAGDVMTTKPYVSGAAYINRMSDFCDTCQFHPKKTCPITPMYWAFLDRNRERLADNPRMALPLRSLERRGEERRSKDRATFNAVRAALEAGREVTPEDS